MRRLNSSQSTSTKLIQTHHTPTHTYHRKAGLSAPTLRPRRHSALVYTRHPHPPHTYKLPIASVAIDRALHPSPQSNHPVVLLRGTQNPHPIDNALPPARQKLSPKSR